MKQRRQYERFVIALPTDIAAYNSPVKRVLHCVTADVSAGGAFFATAEPIAKGSLLRIRALLSNKRVEQLTGVQGQLEIEGTVLRSSSEGFAVCFKNQYRIAPLRRQ